MLGSRKLLIFGIVSALVLSLLIVGAFAAEPEDVKSLGGGGAVKSPPASVQPPASMFRKTYSIRTSGAPNSNTLLSDLGSKTYSVYYVYLRGTANGGSFYDPVEVSSDSEFDFRFYYEGTTCYAEIDGTVYSIGYKGSYIDCVLASYEPIEPVNTGYLSFVEIAPTFNMGALLESMLGVGTQLIAFVIARPIVLIPTVAMILVLSYGVIRRLIKGV